MNYNFSYEQLYLHFGQFDSFVRLTFEPGSEAHSDFGESIMGEFLYTLKEREELEIIIKGELTTSNKYVKFKPSPLENLTDEQIERLDRSGILSGDIINVLYSTLPRKKNYKSGEVKNLTYIEIPFDATDFPLNEAELFYLNEKIKNRTPLIQEEIYSYFGLQLFFQNEIAAGNRKHVYNADMKTIKDEVLYYLFKAKINSNQIQENEWSELQRIHNNRINARIQILIKELKLASGNLKNVYSKYREQIECLFILLYDFNTEVIVDGKKPIWWDFERFLHIYVRHVKETRIGENFESKTLFQYELNEVNSIIKKVIESVYSQILEDFDKNPDKPFFRQNIRSEYFDGIYYRLEIEPTGRLLTFHPYNNDVIDKTPDIAST